VTGTTVALVGGMLVAAGSAGDRWRLGIGDPTVAGWIIFFGYLVAAYLCVRAAKATSAAAKTDPHAGSPRFWTVLAVGLVILGINKQLDFQTLLLDLARSVARRQGWYAERRAVAGLFIQSVAAGGVVALLVCGWLIRRSLRYQGPALAGIVFLVAFVVIRAASFHHVDRVLCAPAGGLRLHWLLEFGGIAWVSGGALLRILWQPPP